MARLRGPRTGYVPTARELDRDPRVARTSVVGEPDAVRGEGEWARVAKPARPGRHGDRLPRHQWLRLPVALEGARWQPGRSAVLGVVVVTVLAVAVFGLRVVRAQSEQDGRVIAPGGGSRASPSGVAAGVVPVGVPAGAEVGAAGGGSGSSAGGVSPGRGPTSAASGSGAAVVVVHVVGEVRAPGLQRLAAGARVADALEAAGGPTGEADLARVNLARLLVDGEQVQVPAPGDPDPVVGPGGVGTPGVGGGAGGTVPPGGTSTAPTPISLNTADLTTLESLPGVGPVLAQRIVDWRTQHGRFTSVEELGEVSGIGEKLLAQLTPLVTL